MTINNVSKTAGNHPYWVIRYVNNEWWFWGAYDDDKVAAQVAWEEGGEIALAKYHMEDIPR